MKNKTWQLSVYMQVLYQWCP